MQKNYRFSKKQEGTVLNTVGVQILTRSPPPYGGLTPLFLKLHEAKVRWLWMAVKKYPSL